MFYKVFGTGSSGFLSMPIHMITGNGEWGKGLVSINKENMLLKEIIYMGKYAVQC